MKSEDDIVNRSLGSYGFCAKGSWYSFPLAASEHAGLSSPHWTGSPLRKARSSAALYPPATLRFTSQLQLVPCLSRILRARTPWPHNYYVSSLRPNHPICFAPTINFILDSNLPKTLSFLLSKWEFTPNKNIWKVWLIRVKRSCAVYFKPKCFLSIRGWEIGLGKFDKG